MGTSCCHGGVGCRGGCCGLWEEQALVELLLCRFLEMEVERSARSRGFVNEKGASAGRTGQGRLRLPRGPVLHHPALGSPPVHLCARTRWQYRVFTEKSGLTLSLTSLSRIRSVLFLVRSVSGCDNLRTRTGRCLSVR